MSRQQPPDPAEYDSWEAWRKAMKQHNFGRILGPPPLRARGVLIWLIASVLVLAGGWIAMESAGWTMKEQPVRTGLAQVRECSSRLRGVSCTAEVAWEGEGRQTGVTVRSREAISGLVPVSAHEIWVPGYRSARDEVRVWAMDHRPVGHYRLFPLGWIGIAAGIVGLGAILIGPGGSWFVRRSQRQWARARTAAGRSVEGPR